MTLGEKIWRLREGRDMSQDELAERLNVSRQTISNWENDRVTLDAEKLRQLCELFGVSADEMLMGESAPAPAAPPQKKTKLSFIMFIAFLIGALLFAVGGIVLVLSGEDNSSISITLYSSFAFFVFSGACLITALVLYFKRK